MDAASAPTRSASQIEVASAPHASRSPLDEIPTPALEFAGHVLLVAIFAYVIGFVIRGHIAKELRESLDKGIDSATRKIEGALPLLASNFADIFKSALQDGALPYFKEQVRLVGDTVIGEAKSARARFEMLIVEPKGEPSKVRDVVAIAAKLVADGRRDDAEQALLNADLADFEVIEALITLYLGDKRDRADQALSFLLDVRSKFADDPRYYWQLAIVYTRQRKRPEAIEAANRYVALCREKAQDKIAIAGSLVSLGFTHFWFDDLVAAVESTEAALDLLDGTKDKMVYICKSNLAYYYAQLRVNREKALLYAQESLDHTGGAANALDTSGFVRMRFFENDLRELTKARAEFIRAGEVEPGLAAAYRHLAEVDALIKRAKLPPQAIGP